MSGMLEKMLSTAGKDPLPESYFEDVMLSISRADFLNI